MSDRTEIAGDLERREHHPLAVTGDGEGGHRDPDNQPGRATLAANIDAVREAYRRRQTYMVKHGDMTRTIKSKGRELAVLRLRAAGKPMPKGKFPPASKADVATVEEIYPELFEAEAMFKRAASAYEKEMVKIVERLPIASFVATVNGFGLLGAAIIVGVCGDLSKYPHWRMVWKRCGLAVDAEGHAEKRHRGVNNGYSPARRSAIYTIGDSLLKKQNPYRELYLESLAIEHAKAIAEGLVPATTMKATVESWLARGLPPLTRVKKLDPKLHRGAGHIHKRAQRYMEKRLLKHIWQAWRREIGGQGHSENRCDHAHTPSPAIAAE